MLSFDPSSFRNSPKRLETALKEGFGAWKDKDHPELAEGTEKFVRKTRKSSRLAGDQ